ncbi:hypothetical protein BDK51DRAFT_44095 [Blyttiomyces helicus]|uniref:Uncharacterized protein n=1 Tax=Blyttiomyces helicus TaxID=388810 RepID=A0A4P9W748_9FUNG|nr:hypothetical protein BDK51DRAFT_44095 [Blyttiomyces helicus]|eukprot:RKO86580.1 hypothetical protein BDK51DRAFT_44095 [Blyttiomyces helicus]
MNHTWPRSSVLLPLNLHVVVEALEGAKGASTFHFLPQAPGLHVCDLDGLVGIGASEYDMRWIQPPGGGGLGRPPPSFPLSSSKSSASRDPRARPAPLQDSKRSRVSSTSSLSWNDSWFVSKERRTFLAHSPNTPPSIRSAASAFSPSLQLPPRGCECASKGVTKPPCPTVTFLRRCCFVLMMREAGPVLPPTPPPSHLSDFVRLSPFTSDQPAFANCSHFRRRVEWPVAIYSDTAASILVEDKWLSTAPVRCEPGKGISAAAVLHVINVALNFVAPKALTPRNAQLRLVDSPAPLDYIHTNIQYILVVNHLCRPRPRKRPHSPSSSRSSHSCVGKRARTSTSADDGPLTSSGDDRSAQQEAEVGKDDATATALPGAAPSDYSASLGTALKDQLHTLPHPFQHNFTHRTGGANYRATATGFDHPTNGFICRAGLYASFKAHIWGVWEDPEDKVRKVWKFAPGEDMVTHDAPPLMAPLDPRIKAPIPFPPPFIWPYHFEECVRQYVRLQGRTMTTCVRATSKSLGRKRGRMRRRRAGII